MKKTISYCRNCGNKLDFNINYCSECGTKVLRDDITVPENNNPYIDEHNIPADNIITFEIDKIKYKETIKNVSQSGPYIDKENQLTYILAMVSLACFVLIPILIYLPNTDSLKIYIIIGALVFLALMILLFSLMAHSQKKEKYGQGNKAWSNGKWLKYGYCHTVIYEEGIDRDYYYEYYIDLTAPSTHIYYDSQLNIINLTGIIYWDYGGGNKISALDPEFGYDFSSYKKIQKLEIPNFFYPNLYEYLQKIINK